MSSEFTPAQVWRQRDPRPVFLSILSVLCVIASVLMVVTALRIAHADSRSATTFQAITGVSVAALGFATFLYGLWAFLMGLGCWLGWAAGWWLMAFHCVCMAIHSLLTLRELPMLLQRLQSMGVRPPQDIMDVKTKLMGRFFGSVLVLLYLMTEGVQGHCFRRPLSTAQRWIAVLAMAVLALVLRPVIGVVFTRL